MPRLPKPRGFDIRDKAADCYDATGQFSHLAAADADTPVDSPTADHEAHDVPDTDGTQPAREDPRTRSGWRALPWWAAGALALVALLAVVLAVHDPERRASRPAPRPAPAAVQPARAPANAVTSPASAAPRTNARHPRSQPARPRSRPVRRRPRPPVAVAKARPVPPPAAPAQRPAPTPEPAGGEFILGAR